MEIIKKIISSILLFICLFVGEISLTKADTLSYDHSGYYYYKTDNSSEKPVPGTLKRFSINNRAGFCIQLGVAPGENQYSKGQWENSSLDDDIKRKVSLIAYYGYDYTNHQSLEFRAATQALIWETIEGNGTNFTFYVDSNRKIEKDISAQKQEILNLVENHDTVPSFSETTKTTKLNKKITFTDDKNILDKFKVVSSDGANAEIVGNSLEVTPNVISDKITITLTRKDFYESEFIVYHADDFQDLIVAGEGYPVSFNVYVKSEGANVKIEKVDSESMQNKAQGDATLSGAVYGIYTTGDDLVTTLTTDESGYALSSVALNLGSYYAKEITPSQGYLLDTTKYNFEITDANEKVIQVKENVIKRTIKFIKVLTNGKTGFQTPEAGIEFGIYDKDDHLVGTYTTNTEGKFEVTLPYGHYVLKQLTTTDNYEKLNDYEFDVFEEGTETKVFADGIITARLKVTKIDATNNEVIPLAHVKFKIYDIKNSRYISQVISYPSLKTIDVFETDENGVMVTPEALDAGEYYLEEVDDAINGYLWNSEKIKFTIDKNSNFVDSIDGKLIEINFANNPVKGKIELVKIGKFLDFKDKKIIESQNKLANVKFGLYARENIYDGTGKLIYKKNKLIGEYLTNEDGYLEINELYLGNYYLKELSTDDNYILDKTKHNIDLEYVDQYTAVVKKEITLENYAKKGTLKFYKIDQESKLPLKGVLIAIYKDDDTLVYEGLTDAKGAINENLPLGKYYIKELKTLDGYVLNQEKQYFEITKDKEEVKITLENRLAKGIVKFMKIDSFTKLPIPGVLIGLYKENGTLIKEVETNKYGLVEMELPIGKYYIKELKTLDNYVLNDEKQYFEITKNKEEVKIVLENRLAKGIVKFMKVDSFSQEPMPGVLIGIYKEDGTLIKEVETNEDGLVEMELPIGKYYIKELKTLDNYVLNDEKQYFEITKDKEEIKITLENRLAKGIFKFLKVDSYTKLPMPGVLFGIYKEDGTLISKSITNDYGISEIELPLGKYYLKELKTLDKYVLDEEKHFFEITEDGQAIEITLENRIAEGTLEFLKIDANTKMPLANVLIAIYNSDNKLVFEGRTDKEGFIKLTLPLDNYYILEKESLPGYYIDTQKIEFSITKDKEIIECTMENTPVLEVEVPDTFADDVLMYGFVPSVIALAITTKYIEEKNKKYH